VRPLNTASKGVAMRKERYLIGVVGVICLGLVSPAAARGPAGAAGGAGSHSNAGGAVRGIERAEDVANPKGVEQGIDKAESKIKKKNNPRNPNTRTKADTDTKSSKTPGGK
jgi:hypothetical protein